MQDKKHLFCGLLSVSLLLACGNNPEQTNAPSATVENLFASKCSMCHTFSEDKIGPGLAGVQARWGNDQIKLKSFIKNSKLLIDSGDPYSVALYKKWNQAEMPSFTDLTDEELNALVEYLK